MLKAHGFDFPVLSGGKELGGWSRAPTTPEGQESRTRSAPSFGSPTGRTHGLCRVVWPDLWEVRRLAQVYQECRLDYLMCNNFVEEC